MKYGWRVAAKTVGRHWLVTPRSCNALTRLLPSEPPGSICSTILATPRAMSSSPPRKRLLSMSARMRCKPAAGPGVCMAVVGRALNR